MGSLGYSPSQGLSGGTSSAALDAAFGSTQGSILYRGASAWTALGPGSAGNTLQSGGAAANPAWGAFVNSVAASAQLAWTTGGTYSIAVPQILFPTDQDGFILAGASASAAAAKSLTISAGKNSSTGDGGLLSLLGGTVGAGGAGGGVAVTGGNSNGTRTAGSVTLTGGNVGGLTTGASVTVGGSPTHFSAGPLTLQSGNGDVGGPGGLVTLASGTGTNSSNGLGGDVVVKAGIGCGNQLGALNTISFQLPGAANASATTNQTLATPFTIQGNWNNLSGSFPVFSFNPNWADSGLTSTTVARTLYVNPTINYTAASKTGNYEALVVNAVETSLPTAAGTANYIYRMQAGASGGTDRSFLWNTGQLANGDLPASSASIAGSPGGTHAIVSSASGAACYVESYGTSGGNPFSNFAGWHARGTISSKAAVQANDELARFEAIGYDGTAFQGSVCSIGLFAAETWSNGSALGNYIKFTTVPTGSIAPAARWAIQPAGHLVGTSALMHGWAASTDPTAAIDANISRQGIGVLQVGTSAANASGTLRCATIQSATLDCSTATLATVVKLNQVSSTFNPTGTTSTSGVMAGLALAFTPRGSGRVLVVVTLQNSNNTTNSGVSFDLRYGTGGAPANGAALTGTVIGGGLINTTAVPSGSFVFGASASGIVTGLSVGTAYWFDAGEYAITSGTATLSHITYNVIEI